jgi:hypothetical protein
MTAATALDEVYAEMGYAPDCLAPLTLEQVGALAVQNELRRNAGNVSETARSLGISRSYAVTLRGRFVSAIRSIAPLAALFVICAHLCPSVASAAAFSEPPPATVPSPKSALLTSAMRAAIAPRPATNGTVMLVWDAGESPQTVVNLSNKTATAVGLADIATIGGLQVGSVNTFVVTNVSGASNLATTTAQRGTNRITTLGTITIYGADRVPGRTNWLLTSSNLVTWTRTMNLGTNAGRSTFLVTNGVTPAAYYRTLAE